MIGFGLGNQLALGGGASAGDGVQPQYSANILENGTFIAPDTSWTKSIGWTVPGGFANCDGTQVSNTNLTQFGVLKATWLLELSFELKNRLGGSVTPIVGIITGTSRNVDGVYVEQFQMPAFIANFGFSFRANAGFIGEVHDAVLRVKYF